jgi:hypothetical protein
MESPQLSIAIAKWQAGCCQLSISIAKWKVGSTDFLISEAKWKVGYPTSHFAVEMESC